MTLLLDPADGSQVQHLHFLMNNGHSVMQSPFSYFGETEDAFLSLLNLYSSN